MAGAGGGHSAEGVDVDVLKDPEVCSRLDNKPKMPNPQCQNSEHGKRQLTTTIFVSGKQGPPKQIPENILAQLVLTAATGGTLQPVNIVL